MPNQSQTRTHTVAPAIPLRNLPSGTTQSQGSSHTTTPPTIPRRTAVPSSSQVVPAQRPSVTVNQSQEGHGSAPVPAHSAPQSSSPWAKRLRNTCSSSRINVWIALTALGVGAYYYYGQYVLALKTWETGLWKDCHDRLSIANSSVCIQYLNVSYEELAGRSLVDVASVDVGSLTIKPTLILSDDPAISTPWGRDYLLVWGSDTLFVGCLIIMIAKAYNIVVLVTDMIFGHNFFKSGHLSASALIYIFMISSILLESGIEQKLHTLAAVFLVALSGLSIRLAWKTCLDASRDPKKRLIWKRKSLWGPVGNPDFYLQPVICVTILKLQVCFCFLLSDRLKGVMEAWYPVFNLSLVLLFTILGASQNVILKTTSESGLDVESQSTHITRVSHKLILLDRWFAAGNRFTKTKID